LPEQFAGPDAFVCRQIELHVLHVATPAHELGWESRLVGGTFLFCLGVSMFRSQPKMQPPPRGVNGLIGAYATTFVLTISNPVTILSFVAIYAGWHVESLQGNYWGAATLTLGVFLGSALWWVGLFIGLTACRERFSLEFLRRVHQISGMVIAGFGVLVLSSVVVGYFNLTVF
jgi:threonine/homoserine/homoserine lactone efflux protein